MSYDELIELLIALDNSMDNQLLDLRRYSDGLQKQMFDYLYDEIGNFDVENGKLKSGTYLNSRIIGIEKRLYEIIGASPYDKIVQGYFDSLPHIQDENIRLHEQYNGLRISPTDITAANKQLYKLASEALTVNRGIREAFIEPTKSLILQQVLTGQTIQQAKKLLRQWNDGETRNGRYILNGKRTPTIEHYITQIARDTSYGVDRTTNHVIKEKYTLNSFAYVGGIIEDSRPLCVYLVNLMRHIRFDELPPLLRRFPDGLYPNTTEDNFCQYCGGYSCRHKAFPVREA